MATERNTKNRTVTMSDEAWEALRTIAAENLRTMNGQLEFLVLNAAKKKAEADA